MVTVDELTRLFPINQSEFNSVTEKSWYGLFFLGYFFNEPELG